MAETFYSDKGGYMQEVNGEGRDRLVPFPVCLAIRYGDTVPETCPDFVLNLKESWVFISMGGPLPEGDTLLMHFYIPPENKLLAEITGVVIARHRQHRQFPSGIVVSFSRIDRRTIASLEDYINGSRHLVDLRS